MRAAGGITVLAGLLLAGCQTMPPVPACPVGQDAVRTAQLFFGKSAGGQPQVADADFRRYVDEELTPRFPDGLTVMDGGGQWQGDANKMIRESAKVVLIVLPKGHDAGGRIADARAAYKRRFHEDTLMLLTQPSCVPL